MVLQYNSMDIYSDEIQINSAEYSTESTFKAHCFGTYSNYKLEPLSMYSQSNWNLKPGCISRMYRYKMPQNSEWNI